LTSIISSYLELKVGRSMKLYGFEALQSDTEPVLRHLTQATIVATPDRLRQIAQFLVRTAEVIEAHGHEFNHAHFSDFCKETHSPVPPGDIDLIVAVPRDPRA
jgi:hypothetical protein